MKREFGVILQREAIRQSRRWQTYALRFAFSGATILGLWYALDSMRVYGANAGELAHMGRTLFQAYISLQLAVVCFVSPCVLMLRYVRSAGGWQGVRSTPGSNLEARDRRIARAPTSQRHRNSSNG